MSRIFYASGLKSVNIAASVLINGPSAFSFTALVLTVTFSRRSRLSRIENGAFGFIELAPIRIPASVEVLGDSALLYCRWLNSLTFDVHPSLRDRYVCWCLGLSPWHSLASLIFGRASSFACIAEGAFLLIDLAPVHVPASVQFICMKCFSADTSRESFTVDPGSQLWRIRRLTVFRIALISVHIPVSVTATDEH
jgi:hypothetical protein